MKKYIIPLLVSLSCILTQCSRNSRNESFLPINKIDTIQLSSVLKVAIKAYRIEHASYLHLVIACMDSPLHMETEDQTSFFIIGPANFYTEFTEGDFFYAPSMYFDMDSCRIFFVSTIDRLCKREVTRSVAKKYANPADYPSDADYNAWKIKILKNNYTVIEPHCESASGIVLAREVYH